MRCDWDDINKRERDYNGGWISWGGDDNYDDMTTMMRYINKMLINIDDQSEP